MRKNKPHPLPDSEYRLEVSEPAKNIKGIGRMTYIITTAQKPTIVRIHDSLQNIFKSQIFKNNRFHMLCLSNVQDLKAKQKIM